MSCNVSSGVSLSLSAHAVNDRTMHSMRIKVTIFFIFVSPWLFFNCYRIRTKKLQQHQLQKEASEGNDCTENQEIGPLAFLLPVGHGFADRDHRDGRIGGINRKQGGFHLADQPNYNGKSGNNREDFL